MFVGFETIPRSFLYQAADFHQDRGHFQKQSLRHCFSLAPQMQDITNDISIAYHSSDPARVTLYRSKNV
jgi:hypothetical protein